jgi:phosphatidylglycerophosphate synthase
VERTLGFQPSSMDDATHTTTAAATRTDGRPAATRAPQSIATGPFAVVLATAPARDGDGPAALLPWESGTVLARLLAQLASLGVTRVAVLTRPAWRREIAAEAPGAEVLESDDAAADLRRIAGLALDAAAGLVLLHGDIVTHREALAGLLADPRVATGVLGGGGALARPFAFRFRARRGRIISAASPYHSTFRPTAPFLGALKVAPADVATLAAAAGRLGEAAEAPPPQWQEELRRKEGMWRMSLYRRALDAETEEDPNRAENASEGPEDVDDDDPAAASEEELTLDRFALELSDDDETQIRERVAAAPDDVVSMLLVGLVRSGAHVSVSHLRKLFWARPLSLEGVRQAGEDILGYDEDRVLLDSAVKARDGFFTTFFVSPYSRYIARWAAHRGYTPNQITTVSVLMGLVAAILFATGERWGLIAGAVVLQIAFTTDCVDGQLARYSRQFSKLGAWLDSVFDRTKEYLAFAGLAIGASRMGDPVWTLACSALILQGVRHLSDFSYGAGQQQVIGATTHPPLTQSYDIWGAAVESRREARREAMARAEAAGVPFEEFRDESGPPPTPAQRVRRALRLVLKGWHFLDRAKPLQWAKRMIMFPIGERFAAISITAALFTPRVTFIVLLAWGGFATVYVTIGRLLRSFAR